MTSFAKKDLKTAFSKLDALISSHRLRRAKAARDEATGFNVFDFIKPTENTLSDILRFLLDPAGSHGQSDVFLRNILNTVRSQHCIISQEATVVREAPTYTLQHRRRIDVLVTTPNFCLGIETKKFSGEGARQIHDYCEHLRNISNGAFCLIFLNRTGSEAESIAPELAAGLQKKKQLVIWSWEKSIPQWLDQCRASVTPPKIKHFLNDFAEYISSYLATQRHAEDENDR
jgi:hypothetical protein